MIIYNNSNRSEMSLSSECALYCSVITKMGEDIPFFNNNNYWEITSIIRRHKAFCENIHSVIYGINYFCINSDLDYYESSLSVVRAMFKQALEVHGEFLRKITPYIKN